MQELWCHGGLGLKFFSEVTIKNMRTQFLFITWSHSTVVLVFFVFFKEQAYPEYTTQCRTPTIPVEIKAPQANVLFCANKIKKNYIQKFT